MIRCALVDATGLSAAVPEDHCVRCLADPAAPRSLDAEVNRDLLAHLTMRRVQAGDTARAHGLISLDEAVRRALASRDRETVQEWLLEAVRRGRVTPERALAIGGETS